MHRHWRRLKNIWVGRRELNRHGFEEALDASPTAKNLLFRALALLPACLLRTCLLSEYMHVHQDVFEIIEQTPYMGMSCGPAGRTSSTGTAHPHL